MFLLEVNAVVADGALRVDWSFDPGRLEASAVEAQSVQFMDHVRSMMQACAESDGDTTSTSDFPLAGLDQNELGKLAALLARKDGKQ